MSTAPSPQALLEHAGAVRAMARGVLGDDDRVDDVVQDAFVAALSRERPPSRLRSWLASVGRRRAWDVRRKDAVRVRHETAAAGAAASLSAPSSAELGELAERAELTRRLVVEMLALDATYRDVLLLRYWEGLPPREIAVRLNAPVETVRTRIRRAHEQLRARLDAAHGGDRRAWAATLATWAGVAGGASAAAGVAAGASALAMTTATSPGDEVPAASSVAGHAMSARSLLAIVGGVVVITAVVVLSRPWHRNDEPAPSENPRGSEAAANQSAGPSSRGVLAAKPAGEGPAPVAAPDDDAKSVDATRSPACCPGPKAAPPRGPLTVRGTVKDTGGSPVSGIPVRYSSKPADPKIDGPGPSERFTDAEGRYEIDGLFPGSLWMSLLTEVGFGPNPERTIDPAAAPTQDFVVTDGVTLAGEVRAAQARVTVWLESREERPGRTEWNSWETRRVTLAAGARAFRFTALKPRTYALRASSEGATPVVEMLPLFADRSGVAIELRPTPGAQGRVVVSPPLDAAGSWVWMRSEDGERARYFPCDRDGVFHADEMPAGRYRLDVKNRTWPETAAGRGGVIETDREGEVTLPVESGRFEVMVEPDEEVLLWVRPPSGVAVQGSVRVLDGPGPRAEQWFLADARGGPLKMVSRGTTRDDGALLVRELPKGRFTLRVTALGFAPVERQVSVAGPTRLDVSLEPLRGRVVRAEIADDYWEVEERRAGGNGPWRRILWKDDRVHMSDSRTPGESTAFLESGEHEFRAVSSLHAPSRLGPLRIDDGGEPLTLEFAETGGTQVSGTLKTTSGAAVSVPLYVFLAKDDGAYRRLEEKMTQASRGVFAVRGLARGRYRLSPSAGGDPVVAEVEVGEADVSLEAALPR